MREVSEKRKKIIYEEIDYLQSEGLIDSDASEKIKGKYTVTRKYEFINVVILFSVALMSIGVIGFAALNWNKIPDVAKISSLIILLLILLISAIYMESRNNIASRVLYSLGMVEFLASIYLIKEIIGVTGNNIYSLEMFIWTVGVTPLVLIKKDRVINIIYSLGILGLIMSGMRSYYYRDLTAYSNILIRSLIVFIFVAVNYYIVRKMRWESVSFIFANLSMYVFINTFMNLLLFKNRPFFSDDQGFFWGVFLRILSYLPAFIFALFLERKYAKSDSKVSFEGNIFHFISALLILNSIYSIFDNNMSSTLITIALGTIYIVYLMSKVRRGSTINIIFSAIVIINIYSRISDDYISKPLIFLGSGLIIFLAAFYIKKKGRISYKEKALVSGKDDSDE